MLFRWADLTITVRDERVESGNRGWEDCTIAGSGKGRSLRDQVFGRRNNRLAFNTSEIFFNARRVDMLKWPNAKKSKPTSPTQSTLNCREDGWDGVLTTRGIYLHSLAQPVYHSSLTKSISRSLYQDTRIDSLLT